MMRQAVISECGRYRYGLRRQWFGVGPRALFIMLNPSTADAELDDPTIRRCIGFARRFGCSGVDVVNLYAWRATKPADLWTADDPVGPKNDEWLTRAFRAARLLDAPVVAAWGAHARPGRVAEVLSLPYADRLQALGVTKAGAPRHPLYLRADADLTPWRPNA